MNGAREAATRARRRLTISTRRGAANAVGMTKPFSVPSDYAKIKGAGVSSLDLGSGSEPQNPFNAGTVWGIDIVDVGNPAVRTADLVIEPIPFPDASFDFVTAFDFIEHVPRLIYVDGVRKAPFIDLMSEVWRVLKPNGLLYAMTPAVPMSSAFVDPTHVNFITKRTVNYFAGNELELCRRFYGFTGEFQVVDQYWHAETLQHLVWLLKAVKPSGESVAD